MYKMMHEKIVSKIISTRHDKWASLETYLKKIIRPTHQSFDNGIIILNGLPGGYLLPYLLIWSMKHNRSY